MKKTYFLITIALLGLFLQSMAQGDLLVTPTRVVFDGNKQKEELNLVNIGADTASYSISFVQYNMKEDGSFVIIDKQDSGQMFADPFLRIFPRKVTLAPREPQVVILQYRRRSDMAEGEYRSHLHFRAEKNSQPLGMANAKPDTTQVKVQLIPVFGVTIPVIIRVGNVNVSATLNNLTMETQQDTIHFLRFTINRTGNISIYGDLVVTYTSSEGKVFEVGKMKGVGVYTNINKRHMSIKLNIASLNLTSGKLEVKYLSHEEPKKAVVYAEGELKNF